MSSRGIIFSLILISLVNWGFSQKENHEFVIDLFENLNMEELSALKLDHFSVDKKIKSSIRPFAMHVPYSWYGMSNWGQTYYDSLKLVPIDGDKINRSPDLRKRIKANHIPVKCRGLELKMCQPVQYGDHFFVHFYIIRNSQYYGLGVFVWLLKYDSNWQLIEVKSGYSIS